MLDPQPQCGIVNTRYRHTLRTPKMCACYLVVSITHQSRYRHIWHGPSGICARNEGNSKFCPQSPWTFCQPGHWKKSTMKYCLICWLEREDSQWNHIHLSCYLASCTHTRIKHRYNDYTRTCHRTNEHIDTCLPHVSSFTQRHHILWRQKSLWGQNDFLVCLERGVPVPITKAIWWGKVGTPKIDACNVTVPVTIVSVTSIYYTSNGVQPISPLIPID